MTTTPCQEAPELWVSSQADARREAARECRGCPIIAECLAGAIQRRERFAVFGGVDFSDARTRPRFAPRALQPINHGTAGGYRMHGRRREPMCEPCRRAGAVERANRAERVA